MTTPSQAEINYELAHADEDRRPTIIAVLAVFMTIAALTTMGRLWSRWFQGRAFALDDYLMIPGTVICAVNVIAGCFEAHYGYGKHMVLIPEGNYEGIGKWTVVNLWSYIWCITFIKLSILALIYRIFNGHGQQNRLFTWTLYFLVGWVIVWLIALCFAFGFVCQPFESQWSVSVDHCQPPWTLDYAATILNSAHDVAIFVLPQPIVWKLQMPMRKKFTISIIFMIGIVATVAGLLKIVFLQGIPGVSHPDDLTYNIAAATIFTSMEPVLAIICGNLPAMPTLFQKMQVSELSQSIKSALTRLVSTSSASSDRVSSTAGSDGGRDAESTKTGHSASDIVITSGWEVSKERVEPDEDLEAQHKKEAVPFA